MMRLLNFQAPRGPPSFDRLEGNGLQCSSMSEHRWEEWIESEGVKKLLWKWREQLKIAWGWDREHPASHPINTSYALAEMRESLSRRTRKQKISIRTREPRSLAELFPEKLVEIIWEEHHSGSLTDAIRRAARVEEEKKSWKALQGIIRAMEIAFLVSYIGIEMLPRPKVSILHRGLDQIAKAVGLKDQTEEGFAEFLDDICPCGIKNHKGAVRKLGSRSASIRRPKA